MTAAFPIDNNSVEQLMKQVAMGRKAWLFVCSVAGGEQSARMMTLVSSARRHDLDVGLYLKDVLDQLLAGCTDYDRLLPDVWKQSHPEAVRHYRVEERRDKAERKQLEAARRRLAASRLNLLAPLPPHGPGGRPYQRHRLMCPCCGETTCAELPVGVPQGQSGPRLMALTALLMAFYRQSKRRHGRVSRHVVGPAVLPGVDGENPKPRDRSVAAVVRGVGGSTAGARAFEHRRNGDQGRKRQGVALDVRGPAVHGVRGAAHARGHGAGRVLDRQVPRRCHLRSGEDVLAGGTPAMVLGAPESATSKR